MAVDTFTGFFDDAFSTFPSTLLKLCDHQPHVVIASAFSAVFIPFVAYSFASYVALGPGGMPNYITGFIMCTLMKAIERETLSTDEYENSEDGVEHDHWLGASHIPERNGPRPKFGWACIPQRQIDQFPSNEMKAALVADFDRISRENPTLVEVALSPNEKRYNALVMHHDIPTPHEAAKVAKREIVHIHRFKDFSMHVVLAPKDCKLVIEKGWGERHPVSGRSLPKEYLIIYAPRTAEELRVVGQIIRASVGFMTTSHNVK